jgi:hypothetical protein
MFLIKNSIQEKSEYGLEDIIEGTFGYNERYCIDDLEDDLEDD